MLDIPQQRIDEINERLRPLIQRVADASVPLCQAGRRGAVVPIGSGVLLRIGDRRYLLTASHVFGHAQQGQSIAAIAGTRFVSIGKRWRTVDIPARPDCADLAVSALEDAHDEDWSGARFITLDEIDPFGEGIELAPTTSFLALGYPRSKQPKIIKDGSYSAFAYHFLSHLEPITPKSIKGVVPDQHIVIGYDRRGFSGDPRVSEMPDPDGMSGGGLWRVPSALTTLNPVGRLVGILIEHRRPHKIIVASRIGETLRFLRGVDPSNAPEIDARFPSLSAQAT